jgi:hypothetical protein
MKLPGGLRRNSQLAALSARRSTKATSAEDRGFEPLRGFPQHAFQACALGHYANPPSKRIRRQLGHSEPWVAAGRDFGCRSSSTSRCSATS